MKKSLVPIAILVIVAVSVSFFWKSSDQTHSLISGNIQESLGQVAADQAAKLVGEGGGKVLVLLMSKGETADDPNRSYRLGFEKALKRHPTLTLTKIDSGSYYGREGEFNGFNPMLAFYQHRVSENPDVACIVSFYSAPTFATAELATWDPAVKTKLIVMAQPIPNLPAQEIMLRGIVWPELIRRGIVHVALVPILAAKIPNQEPQGPYQQIFDRFYTVVNAENLEKQIPPGAR